MVKSTVKVDSKVSDVCPDCIPLCGGDDVLLCAKCEAEQVKLETSGAVSFGSVGSSESVVYMLGQLLTVNQRMLAVLERAASAEVSDGVAEELRGGERLSRGEVFEKEDPVEDWAEASKSEAVVVDWRCDVCLECFEEPLLLKGVKVCPACKKPHIHVCRAEDIILSKKKLKDPVVKSLKSQGYVHYKKPVDVFVKYVNASGEGGV